MRLTHYDEHKKRWQINDDYGAVMIDELNYAVGEAIDKLAAYEDAEEQGRLVILPPKKGISMPKDCPRGCKAVKDKRYAMETEPEYFDSNCRPPWCPLVSVPPHGRLIDADAFIRNIAKLERVDPITAAGVIAFVNAAPTIIEAEGET